MSIDLIDRPRVDIVVPVFNPGVFFEKTLDALLKQTYQNIRILVVDDGSSLDGKNYIIKLCSRFSNIHLFRLEENCGGGTARNAALAIVDSDYIAFCDSDDIWPSDKLTKQMNHLLRNRLDMTHCNMIRVDGRNHMLRETPDEINLNVFLSTTDLFCSSVVLSRRVLHDAKFGTMKARHPFKFWVDILSRGVVSYRTPNTYFYYTVRPGSVSSNKFKMFYYTFLAYFMYAPSFCIASVSLIRRFVVKPSLQKLSQK